MEGFFEGKGELELIKAIDNDLGVGVGHGPEGGASGVGVLGKEAAAVGIPEEGHKERVEEKGEENWGKVGGSGVGRDVHGGCGAEKDSSVV